MNIQIPFHFHNFTVHTSHYIVPSPNPTKQKVKKIKKIKTQTKTTEKQNPTR